MSIAHLRQRSAQVAREVVQHGLALVGIGQVEALDMGKRIEKEMRLDLRLQNMHLRLGHLLLECNAGDLRRVQVRRDGDLMGDQIEDARQEPAHQQCTKKETDQEEQARNLK